MLNVTGLVEFDAAGAALELELDDPHAASPTLQPPVLRREARRAV